MLLPYTSPEGKRGKDNKNLAGTRRNLTQENPGETLAKKPEGDQNGEFFRKPWPRNQRGIKTDNFLGNPG